MFLHVFIGCVYTVQHGNVACGNPFIKLSTFFSSFLRPLLFQMANTISFSPMSKDARNNDDNDNENDDDNDDVADNDDDVGSPILE